MAKLTSFNDFIGNDGGNYTPKSNYQQPKPYIYVIKYIMGKEEYIDELKEYILNYRDEESDFEDDKAFDPFMNKLKNCAKGNNIDEIEDLILDYEDYVDVDFDEDDEDYEEKMYNKDGFADEEDNDIIVEETDNNGNFNELSDKLKDFLKMDTEYEIEDIDEDLIFNEDDYDFDDYVQLEEDEENLFVDLEENIIEDIDYEEIKDIDYTEYDESPIQHVKVPKMRDDMEEDDSLREKENKPVRESLDEIEIEDTEIEENEEGAI